LLQYVFIFGNVSSGAFINILTDTLFDFNSVIVNADIPIKINLEVFFIVNNLILTNRISPKIMHAYFISS